MKRLCMIVILGLIVLWTPSTVRAERYVITVGNFMFTPADISGLTGDQFVWSWIPPFGTHTVTEDSATPLFDSGIHTGPFRFRRIFIVPGDYFYHCQIHGGAGGIGQSGVVRVSTRDFDDEDDDERPLPTQIRR